MLLPSEDLQARKFLSLEKLEAGAASGGDVTKIIVGESQRPNRCRRVSPADNPQPGDPAQGRGNDPRPLRKGGEDIDDDFFRDEEETALAI